MFLFLELYLLRLFIRKKIIDKYFKTVAIKTTLIYNTSSIDTSKRYELNKEITTLPMIALRGMVIFPDTTVSMDIGRQKSILALDKSVDTESTIFVATQKDLTVAEPMSNDIYSMGTVAQVLQVIRVSSDSVRAIIKGLYPAKIQEFTSYEPYLQVTVVPQEYKTTDSLESEAFLRQSRDLIAQLGINSNKLSKETLLKVSNVFDPNEFVNIVASEIIYKDDTKQKLLQTLDVNQRLDELCKILINEVEIAKIDKRIANRVKRQIDKSQKEFYLKEQMRAITEELGESEDEIVELDAKIDKAKMPNEVATKAHKEVKRLSKMVSTSPDAGVIRAYIEWLTDLEWNKSTVDNKNLILAKQRLDEDHFGLEKIKERIIEYLAVMQMTGGQHGPILCFVGPPGVGKTSIVRSIARALDRKYYRMSLGGVRDEAEIRGHRRTYIGAMPGKIIYMLKQVQSVNPVLLFDEIDKMSSDFHGDPASAMLEVLDPEQNYAFVDHYLEVPFNLSKVLFVCTANSVDTIPPALLDRMEIIELTGYTEEEKIQIAQKFLVPKQEKENGLDKNTIAFSDEVLLKIIESYTRESGVRQLEREIATVCRKVVRKRIEENLTDFNIVSDNLMDYLGIEKFKNDVLDKNDEIGSATGLAWTVVGGTTLTIDVTLFSGKGEILLTGMLGDVMKESARTAISLVRSLSDKYGISEDVFNKTDIHIHIPEGAIPKDGPSAGITMATAIMSAFSHKPVSKKVAMTGEVTLRGKVLPIGGLKEKMLAAFRAGIRKIIIPKDNENDLLEIPKEVVQKMEVTLADNISVVFDNALV